MGFYDLALDWDKDLQVSAQGDLLQVTNLDLLKQRIIRRILTNKGALIFEPLYGAGLPQFVCAVLSPDVKNEMKQRVIQEVYKEEAVVRDPGPEINFRQVLDGIIVYIRVWTIDSRQIALQFEVNRNGNI